MPHDATDHDLIRRCLAGDAAGWDTLVTRYERLVYSVPRRFGLNDADAEDVTQTVFQALYRNLGALRDHQRLPSWLITSAHRATWRVGRRNDRYPDLVEQMPDVSAPDDRDADRWERQHLVRTALTTLGGKCERLLSALFLRAGKESADYGTIAQRLDIPIGSIGPTRARCLAKLERILRAQGFDPAVELSEA